MSRVYSKAYRSDEPAMSSIARVYPGACRAWRGGCTRLCRAFAAVLPAHSRSRCSHCRAVPRCADSTHEGRSGQTPAPHRLSPRSLHADVNVNNPKEYWDYENLAIDWGCVPCWVHRYKHPLLSVLRWVAAAGVGLGERRIWVGGRRQEVCTRWGGGQHRVGHVAVAHGMACRAPACASHMLLLTPGQLCAC